MTFEAETHEGLHGVVAADECADEVRFADLDDGQPRYGLSARVHGNRVAVRVAGERSIVRGLEAGARRRARTHPHPVMARQEMRAQGRLIAGRSRSVHGGRYQRIRPVRRASDGEEPILVREITAVDEGRGRSLGLRVHHNDLAAVEAGGERRLRIMARGDDR